MQLDQTTIYIIIAAVAVGIYFGGAVVMTLVRILSGFFRQQQTYYDPNGYPPTDDRRDRGGGCFTIIFMGIIGVLVFTQFVDSKFVKAIFNDSNGSSKPLEAPMESKKDRYDRLMEDGAKSETAKPIKQPETEQQTPAPAFEASMVDNSETFVVQIGAYANKEGARTVFQENAQKGHQVGIFTKEGAPGQTLYVIIIGEALTKSAAEALCAKVNLDGSRVIPADDLDLHYSEIYLRR